MLYQRRGFKDFKERTISSLTPGAAPGHFERYKGNPIGHVNPPSSRDRLEGFRSDERKLGTGGSEEDAAAVEEEREEGNEKGGSQQKLN